MAKVKKFDTGIGQDSDHGATANRVPDIPAELVSRITDSAPIQIKQRKPVRVRRHIRKNYSLTQQEVDLLETLFVRLQQAGVSNRSRSDIVRAGITLLGTLSPEGLREAVEKVECLRA